MAKRMSDTQKFNKRFYRNLTAPYKLFWDYICLECDHAGIWHVDIEVANVKLGKDVEINYDEALKHFNDDEERILVFDNKKKWFIPSFIEFQYGQLKANNNMHNSVIRILKENELLEDYMINPDTTPKKKSKEKEIEVKEEIIEPIVEKTIIHEKSPTPYHVDDLYDHYINKPKLMASVSINHNMSEEEIRKRLLQFTINLKSTDRTHETWAEYTKYFNNWNKKIPIKKESEKPHKLVKSKDLWQ